MCANAELWAAINAGGKNRYKGRSSYYLAIVYNSIIKNWLDRYTTVATDWKTWMFNLIKLNLCFNCGTSSFLRPLILGAFYFDNIVPNSATVGHSVGYLLTITTSRLFTKLTMFSFKGR